MELHPHFLEKEGEKEFVVIPFNEFEKMYEALEEYEDLKALRSAKEEFQDKKGYTIQEMKRMDYN